MTPMSVSLRMTRPADCAHVDPLGLETELLEFGRDHVADSGDSGLIHRPAVLVDPALEHRDRARLLGIDGLDHHLLGGGERGCGWAGGEERDSEKRVQES